MQTEITEITDVKKHKEAIKGFAKKQKTWGNVSQPAGKGELPEVAFRRNVATTGDQFTQEFVAVQGKVIFVEIAMLRDHGLSPAR